MSKYILIFFVVFYSCKEEKTDKSDLSVFSESDSTKYIMITIGESNHMPPLQGILKISSCKKSKKP